ncbi:hypothetical protein Fleli_3786 [Bernardetia litoralis DSM 6794]|uniref:Uncharacterized protein n=1 Tax=Bernardetia litoralis (strain ATCC 23117 / DSM 6794 / NBRC 15988 / NCIMB 1366 / Fx l1 / Sio-4) TaxID=880071 RepID=I4AQ62_BERLS|nr:hypothetical protein [Bernardetia litoralis]AFM06097.1 hypothetical protein Fleli_3786 [Bernardetia litoralis DSM 6794]
MKEIIVILILFWLSPTAFSATSYWVFYDEITCFVPLPPSVQASWGGDGSEPADFIVFEDSDSTMKLTDCLDSCKLYSSSIFNEIYTSQILGDTLLELHAKNTKGKIVKILYYRRIVEEVDLSFKNNDKVFTNGNNFLFQNINIFNQEHFDYMHKTYNSNTFYQISENKGNLYDLHKNGGYSKTLKEYDNILFFKIEGKIYCEAFYRVNDNYSITPYHSDFKTCTLEEARAEIQRISKKRRILIEN